MKVIICTAWGGSYSVPILRKLFNQNIDIVKIYSMGTFWKRVNTFPPIRSLNYVNNVREMILSTEFADIYEEIKSVNDESVISFIKENEVDYLLCVSYGEILRAPLIHSLKKGVINFHPGILPENQGANPISAAIFNEHPKIGVTIHYIDEGVDTGEILLSKTLDEHHRNLSYNALDLKLGYLASDLVEELIDGLKDGTLVSYKQNTSANVYYPKLKIGEEAFDFNDNALDIDKKIRCFSNMPFCAYFQWGDVKVRVESCMLLPSSGEVPSKVLDRGFDYIIVSCIGNDVLLSNIKIDGMSKEMSIQYLTNRCEIGQILKQ